MSEESQEFDRDFMKVVKEKKERYNDECIEEMIIKPIRANYRKKVPRLDGGFNIHYSICVPEELNTPFIQVELPIKILQKC